MRIVHWKSTAVLVFVMVANAMVASVLTAAEGRFVVPEVTGRTGLRVFTGHPGWVDAFAPGYGKSVSSRINEDGSFKLEGVEKPVSLIAMFDRIETPPIIVPHWPVKPGDYAVEIPVEYSCFAPGPRDQWDAKYMMRATNFWQTFIPAGTQIYGISVYDGPKIVEWGNKIHASVFEDGPEGRALRFVDHHDGEADRMSAGHSFHEMPRMGFRHGDVKVQPGRTYALRVGGYLPHGGEQLRLDAFVRPDHGEGYLLGSVLADGADVGGDLCCLVFGNAHGQIVENQIRSEEWEIFVPRHRPTQNWGQTFVAHGVSLAGVSFWGSNGSDEHVMCEVRVREGGVSGKMLKPAKIARGMKSPLRPIIRYPDVPAPLPGYEAYCKLPCDLFQVAFKPDEIKLTPGETYYIDLLPSKPILVYADGDYYKDGYAYYEGLKVDEQVTGQQTFHSFRWTLAMNIVTYAWPNGQPLHGQ